ncbi:MAG: hypothetical protein AMS25_02025 [Gemmatimonas sp. SM23_52]|nr:MAG: hypothetical protein AMS25_02025 [Gemmatimonas sp. SM23_52]
MRYVTIRAAQLLCLAAGLFVARSLAAQVPDTLLTLAGARSLLRQGSPDYRAALAAADAAGEEVWSAWGSLLPTATLQASFGRNEFTTRTFVDPIGVSQEVDPPVTDVSKSVYQSLVFNWSVFEGGRQFFDIGAANARARAADLAAVARRVQLESQLETQYFEALKQQELARLARDLLAARRRDLEITQARFRIAAVAQTDVLQAEIQVGQQQLAALRAELAAEAARRELSKLVGLEEEAAYELRDTALVFDPSQLRRDELIVQARRSNPELARLDANIDAQSRSLWSARGSWLPNVSLSFSLSRSERLRREDSMFKWDPRNTGQNFSLSLSWPLFNGFEKKWRTGQASARLQEARHNKVAGLLEVEKEVRNAYDALFAGYQSLRLQARNVELARESVRLQTERYRIGAATYIELQNATTQLTQAEQGLIEARYEFMKSFAQLQGAVGRPIAVPQ